MDGPVKSCLLDIENGAVHVDMMIPKMMENALLAKSAVRNSTMVAMALAKICRALKFKNLYYMPS